MIERDDQDRICVVFLLNVGAFLRWNKDFGCWIMNSIREGVIYAFVMVIVLMMMMIVIPMVMADARIIMVMVGYKAMDQR